jgi:RNA polymerase sigma-70 factor, ECF subfamily
MELRLGASYLGLGNKTCVMDEATLVDRCRRNDLSAFEVVVDRYQARVFGFVRRMVANEEEAADLTQEVFIRAYQNIGRFDQRAPLKTWLFRIAYNLCVDRSRRVSRQPDEIGLTSADSDGEIEIYDQRWQPEESLMEAELVEAVETAIDQMSEKLRCVILLHDREDLSYDEIAKMLRLPVGTVKSRLFLARSFIQERLRQYLTQEPAL